MDTRTKRKTSRSSCDTMVGTSKFANPVYSEFMSALKFDPKEQRIYTKGKPLTHLIWIYCHSIDTEYLVKSMVHVLQCYTCSQIRRITNGDKIVFYCPFGQEECFQAIFSPEADEPGFFTLTTYCPSECHEQKCVRRDDHATKLEMIAMLTLKKDEIEEFMREGEYLDKKPDKLLALYSRERLNSRSRRFYEQFMDQKSCIEKVKKKWDNIVNEIKNKYSSSIGTYTTLDAQPQEMRHTTPIKIEAGIDMHYLVGELAKYGSPGVLKLSREDEHEDYYKCGYTGRTGHPLFGSSEKKLKVESIPSFNSSIDGHDFSKTGFMPINPSYHFNSNNNSNCFFNPSLMHYNNSSLLFKNFSNFSVGL